MATFCGLLEKRGHFEGIAMDREYTSDKVPDRLTAYLESSPRDLTFRRRAVLAHANGEWMLVCCAVEGLPAERKPQPVLSRKYPQALLYEDLLTAGQCHDFAVEVQAGRACIGDIELRRGMTPSHWSTERVPVNNENSAQAGLVISMLFGQTGTGGSVGPLLAPDCAYYPDIDEAVRDWLPFSVYHGSSDARNQRVLFLLPETRAFVAGAAFSDEGQLDIAVAGTHAEQLSLLIKGAYWEGRALHQLSAVICASKATLKVPEDADRLEFYLLDSAGLVYDFHREDQWSRVRGDRTTLGRINRSLQDQLKKAVHEGEGSKIEFKPFVDLQKFAPGDRKTKLHEVARTVVAFANTDGGRIYLGVDDDCSISGIDAKVAAWAAEAVNAQVVSRYLGALKSRIKGLVQGEVGLHLSQLQTDDVHVAVIEVSPAASRPISLLQDYFLYVRTGASNRKVSPGEWRSVLEPIEQDRRL